MFRYPVHFIHHTLDRWLDVCQPDDPPAPDAYGRRLRDGNDNWVLQTYLELKRRHYDVKIERSLVPGAFCVAHYDDIWLKEKPMSSFLVGIRGDRPDISVAPITVVQNACRMRPGKDIFMPHWSQPGLMPRNKARGDTLTNVGYMGLRFNLRSDFRDGEFERGLEKLGMRLIVREYPFQDYTDIDVILAVRPGTDYDINIKPATKLQNAWRAGCPALLGPESGYRQYRLSPLDYIEVNSPAEALEALARLKQDARLYTRMVENGLRRGEEFSHDRLANRWADFLGGHCMNLYENWLRARPYTRWLDYPRFAIQATQHKVGRYIHMRNI